MAHLSLVGQRRPIPGTIAGLTQWASDHERDDDRQFGAIDRKLDWLIRGLVGVMGSIILGLVALLWQGHQDRLTALELAQSHVSRSAENAAR